MKAFCSTLLFLFVLGACSEEKIESATTATTQTEPAAASTATAATATAAETTATTSSEGGETGEEAVQGVWAGQLRIDAHAGVAVLNYVGAESGDFVPMRFRTGSEVGAKILAACGDDDLCEVEGKVRFLDEPPPENASAVGEIVTVDRVKRLPPDAR